MITSSEFDKIPLGDIFATGETENSPEGINAMNYNKGQKLTWIAKKSNGDNSWAIYYHSFGVDQEFIKSYGLKVKNENEILKLVPCDEEMYRKYRK